MDRYRFISWSSNKTANTIDWFRSLYFSLFGSSALTFILRLYFFKENIISLAFFLTGVFAFGLGLYISIGIADRFKRHEKNYDKLSQEDIKAKTIKDYYYEQEIDTEAKNVRNLEHFFFYFIMLIGCAFIGYASFYLEHNTSKSNTVTKEIHTTITKVEQIDSSLTLLIGKTMENKRLEDSLKITKFKGKILEEENDSLQKLIQSLSNKPKKVTQ